MYIFQIQVASLARVKKRESLGRTKINFKIIFQMVINFTVIETVRQRESYATKTECSRTQSRRIQFHILKTKFCCTKYFL